MVKLVLAWAVLVVAGVGFVWAMVSDIGVAGTVLGLTFVWLAVWALATASGRNYS